MNISQKTQKLKTKLLISKKIKTPVLINQGSFGCIYYPNIKCDKYKFPSSIDSDIKYISKVQYNNKTTQNEIELTNEIKKIPLYYFYYAVIENVCSSSITRDELDELDAKSLKKCKIQKEDSELISFNIRYIGNLNLLDYLNTVKNQIFFHKKYIGTFSYVFHSLDKLIEKNIVHYDIKLNNIMYDLLIHNPVIIDFGLSFSMLSVREKFEKDPKTLINYFYTTEKNLFWCFETYFLSIIASILNPVYDEVSIKKTKKTKEQERILDSELINKTCSEFKTNLHESSVFSEEETAINEKNNIDFLSQPRFLKKTLREAANEILKENYFHTWDKYSLIVNYFIVLKRNQIDSGSPLSPSEQVLEKNMKKIILSRPDKRLVALSNKTPSAILEKEEENSENPDNDIPTTARI